MAPFILLCRYTEFGGPVPYRPAEDLAFSVARFIQKGGSFINYYMVIKLFVQFTVFNPWKSKSYMLVICVISIMEEQILAELLGVLSLLLAMIMMLLLMNTVCKKFQWCIF